MFTSLNPGTYKLTINDLQLLHEGHYPGHISKLTLLGAKTGGATSTEYQLKMDNVTISPSNTKVQLRSDAYYGAKTPTFITTGNYDELSGKFTLTINNIVISRRFTSNNLILGLVRNPWKNSANYDEDNCTGVILMFSSNSKATLTYQV